jgi:hypothetical protein
MPVQRRLDPPWLRSPVTPQLESPQLESPQLVSQRLVSPPLVS